MKNLYILLLLSLSFGTVTDIDYNVYETVPIGEQLWMAENLKVTHYNDGSEITHITNNEDWGSLDEGQYGVADFHPNYDDGYGNLHNWAVVGVVKHPDFPSFGLEREDCTDCMVLTPQ